MIIDLLSVKGKKCVGWLPPHFLPITLSRETIFAAITVSHDFSLKSWLLNNCIGRFYINTVINSSDSHIQKQSTITIAFEDDGDLASFLLKFS